MLGTVLHVAVWLSAVGFDLALFPQIDSTNAPSAMVFWTLGFVPMVFGLVVLLVATAAHATGLMPIAEGGAPPYMMTLFIGGAQISLILTILQIVATVGTANNDFIYIADTSLAEDETPLDKRNAIRTLLVLAMLFKIYIVNFLKNNQEWAGPAHELKKQVVSAA